MKDIYGESIQEGILTPEKPCEIKHKLICPKCGSEVRITGTEYFRYKILSQSYRCTECKFEFDNELSTAEKLMWLVENGYMTLNPTLKYGHKAMREIERHMQSTIFDSFDEEIDKYYGLSKEQK